MNKTTLNSQKEKHSTLSLRRATRYAVNQFPVTLISIHALLAESDSALGGTTMLEVYFYPRSPCGERRKHIVGTSQVFQNFYPRSPCGERRGYEQYCIRAREISIHALLAESDNCTSIGRPKRLYFYPRSPCGERRIYLSVVAYSYYISIHALLAESDPPRVIREPTTTKFLSTLSLRRATPAERHANSQQEFLSTLSLRRATRLYVNMPCAFDIISIHALLAESDGKSNKLAGLKLVFLSTLSLRRATHYGWSWYDDFTEFLSTLSLRRATIRVHLFFAVGLYFYPRSPCGERRLFYAL